MRKSNLLGGALLLAALFVNTSCKEIFGNMDLNGGSTVSSYLSISTSTLNLDPGESAQRVATSISPATISYESENPAVATVDQQGNVTAVALGETRIKVSVPASGNYDAGTVYYPVAVKYFTPLTLEAIEDGKVTIMINGVTLEQPIQYAIDGGSKQSTKATTSIDVKAGQKVQFYSTNSYITKGENGESKSSYTTILADDTQCYVYGNVMSMVTPDGKYEDNKEFTAPYALAYLFYKPSGMSNKIMNHPTKPLVLQATTLSEGCYASMFNGCSSLESAPELPNVEELTNYCYMGMFKSCKKLTSAPKLPATKLSKQCYRQMFNSCEALAVAPELPAEDINENCYQDMFNGCKVLKKAPTLPATTIYKQCYANMFKNCEALEEVQAKLPAETLVANCYNGMFNGCKSLEKAPELPATNMKISSVYREMFNGCTKLNYVKCLATSINTNNSYNWLNGVAATGTFVKAKGADWGDRSVKGIPEGWTVEEVE